MCLVSSELLRKVAFLCTLNIDECSRAVQKAIRPSSTVSSRTGDIRSCYEANEDAAPTLLQRLAAAMTSEFFPHLDGLGYSYTGLSAELTTRVLVLYPGAGGSQLEGSLREISLSSAPRYEALSYAWESTAKPFTLMLDEGFTPITKSLHLALLRLRHPSRARVLWADAVCINQLDSREKASQIMLMTKIYSSAARVLCWLGEDNSEGHAAIAIKLIQKVGRTDFSTLTEYRVNEGFMRAGGLPALGSSPWAMIIAFLERPWFHRAWVVQEFVTASEVAFVCGGMEARWEAFFSGAEKIHEYSLLSDSKHDNERRVAKAYTGAHAIRAMQEIKCSRSSLDYVSHVVRSHLTRDTTALRENRETLEVAFPGGGEIIKALRKLPSLSKADAELVSLVSKFVVKFVRSTYGIEEEENCQLASLPSLLFMFSYSVSTDPRDKLYAFLGLCSESNDPALRVDYLEPVESVCIRYTRRYLMPTSGGNIGVLYSAGLAFRGKTTLKLPSWVPDWTSPISLQQVIQAGSDHDNIHRAAGDTKAKPHFTDDPNEVRLVGSLIDRISRIVALPRNPFMVQLFFDGVDKILRDRSGPYPFVSNGEEQSEVMWRTLIRNGDSRGQLADQSLGRSYKEFRSKIKQLTSNVDFQNLPEYNTAWLTNTLGEWGVRFNALSETGMQFCETDRGLIGLVPHGVKVGDSVCILLGERMPYAIRQCTSTVGKYELVAGCYIHGVMHGEALNSQIWKEEKLCFF